MQPHKYAATIKTITNNMLCFKHFRSTCSTIQGIEAMSMIRRGQGNAKQYD